MNSDIFFTFLVADISALVIPGKISHNADLAEERAISSFIEKSITSASQSIKDAGLDPLHINKVHVTNTLPLSILFNCDAFVEDISITGQSNIVIHKISYSILTSRLNFDVELPLISFFVGSASVDARLLTSSLDVKASGKLKIRSIRITGQVRVKIGVLSGISIEHVNMNLTVGDIVSEIKLVIQGKDYSAEVNQFIESAVPDSIKAHNANINEPLENILIDLITENQSQS